jgi:hypothetical protein
MYFNCFIIDGMVYRISNRIMRLALWRANPNCRFCGVETKLPKTTKGNCNQPYDPKMATIEHLYSHYNPKRKIGRNRNKVTLACAECSNERQRKEGHALGIEELRKRSSQHKKG